MGSFGSPFFFLEKPCGDVHTVLLVHEISRQEECHASFRTRTLVEVIAKPDPREMDSTLLRQRPRDGHQQFRRTDGLDVAGGNKRHGERYQPSPVYSLRRLLRRLEIHYPDYSSIDFGSSKGRMLLVAGELQFRQVIGVEFSEELHWKTVQNI